MPSFLAFPDSSYDAFDDVLAYAQALWSFQQRTYGHDWLSFSVGSTNKHVILPHVTPVPHPQTDGVQNNDIEGKEQNTNKSS
ncbi:TPA: hypothetical protein ACHHY3_002819 [Legionella pneumophila]|nr:hypothetical protein [Legionella pneumophila]MCK1847908.1 hypothetical protein [Legionella pneumophila]HAT1880080.1 hypothetical protein [Legionella pneumophila]HBD9444984.1 hypothetical protein [Legionella pneumophila]HCE5644657.1 hypothetical protein [Legionella pneumophila]HCE5647679.1 hypothetical protein [Legionella pneumophila]